MASYFPMLSVCNYSLITDSANDWLGAPKLQRDQLRGKKKRLYPSQGATIFLNNPLGASFLEGWVMKSEGLGGRRCGAGLLGLVLAGAGWGLVQMRGWLGVPGASSPPPRVAVLQVSGSESFGEIMTVGGFR